MSISNIKDVTPSPPCTIPLQVSNLNDVVAVAAGHARSFALKSDGVVWAWGVNWYGQLGDKTYTNRTAPVSVTNINLDTSATPTPTTTVTSTLSPLPTPSPTTSPNSTPWSTCTDDYESNDSFDMAYGPLVSQSSYSGKICSPFDADYFKIHVANPGFISLTLNIPPDKDYELFLYDSRQSPVAFSTMPLGIPETITYFANTTGTYYVQVIGYFGSFDENQTYTLSGTWAGMANATPPPEPTLPPLPTPAVTITPSGLCEAKSIEMSKNRVVLRKGRNRKVTVSVKGAGDCPVEGVTVTASVSSKRISISPVTQQTDENGKTSFTITANKIGRAKVTFKTYNLEKTLVVRVRR